MADKAQKLTLPLLVTRSKVIFPNNSQVIAAGRSFSVKAIEAARNQTDSLLFVSCQKNADDETPTEEQIHKIGSLCRIISYTVRGTEVRIRVEVVERIKLETISEDPEGFILATGSIYRIPEPDYITNSSIIKAVQTALEDVPQIVAEMPKSVANAVASNDSAINVCFAIAEFLQGSKDDKQSILESLSAEELMQRVVLLISGEKQKDEGISRGWTKG